MKNINFSRCFISQKAARSDAFFLLCRKATIKTKKKMRKRESLEAKIIREKMARRRGKGRGEVRGNLMEKKVGK